MTAARDRPAAAARRPPRAALSDLLFAAAAAATCSLLLVPPLLWLGIVYLGSLFALLAQSFFAIDEFTGKIVREPRSTTYAELLQPANLDIILRTVVDGGRGDARLRRSSPSRSPTTWRATPRRA